MTTPTESKPQELTPVQPNRMEIAMSTETSFMDPTIWRQMQAMSKTFFDSKAIPSCWQNPSQVLVGLQYGKEMGMQPMEALNSLYLVRGAVNIWGKAVVKRFKIHGWDIAYELLNERGGGCRATVSKGDKSYTEEFYFDQAEKSKHTKDNSGALKVGWYEGSNRNRKLKYGALALILHTYLPELLGPVSEIQEIAEDVDIPDNNKGITLIPDDKLVTKENVKEKVDELKNNIRNAIKKDPEVVPGQTSIV